MGGIALLAREAGHTVSGSDANVYPPMSTQLEAQGISLMEGYDPSHLDPAPDMVVVGNVMSRGNPAIEYILDRGLPYTSGPQWLSEHVLQGRWVLAVAGTHGKTSTSSLLAWIMEYAGLKPGFLIGGVPENFGVSARLGDEPFFVVEADEYDTAFFDKRSKFVHYHPRTLVMNNLEFDHADIFDDLDAIKRQFHHLVRTVPGQGLIVANNRDQNLDDVLSMGCWTPVESFSSSSENVSGSPTSRESSTSNKPPTWQIKNASADGSEFEIVCNGKQEGKVQWSLLGRHNIENAVAAIAAARHVGVPVEQSIQALTEYKNVKRRLELRADTGGIRLYDDFAHHPTAIATTLAGLRGRVNKERIIVLLEPRSNTMRMGVHSDTLASSLSEADAVLLYQPEDIDWDLKKVTQAMNGKARVFSAIDKMVDTVKQEVKEGDHILVMSNGAFGGIHEKLIKVLEERQP